MNQLDLIQQLKNHKYATDQSCIVAATDWDGIITYVNDKFCEVSGYSREELIGKDHSIINSKYHPASFFRDMWNTIKAGKVWQGDIRNITKEGKYYWVSTTIVPFKGSDGKIFQFLSIRHEITDLKMAQQLILEQQSRLAVASKFAALGEMAANLTHEINNPLAAILGRCEMLIQQLQKSEINQKSIMSGIEAIEFTSRRIEKIIRSMKSFSMAGDGDPFESVNLNKLITETIDFIQQRFKDYGITLTVLPIDMNLTIECRSTEISQVLLNLLNNSFDAIVRNKDKWVEIAAELHDPNYVKITVADSGLGISEDLVNRIFDPFFSTKEKKYGTGLGLSISKGLIDRHHGSIEIDVSSQNTCFVIHLPTHQFYKVVSPSNR